MKKYLLSTTAVLFVAAAAFVSFKVCAQNNKGTAARVNGDVITIEEIRKGYEANPQIAAQVPFDQFYAKAVDILVQGKLIYQAAVKSDVENSEAFKTQLNAAKEDIARKVYLEKVVSEKVTPAAVEDYYNNTYVKEFKSQKEAKAKHILVDDEATAKEVIKKLDQKEDFDKLAQEYSKDQADLGYFTKNLMVPEFSEAAFALEKGKYSAKPVKTQFGYHVILLEDIRDSKPLELKTIEPQIQNLLTQQVLANTFDTLVKDSSIEKFDLEGNKLEAPKVAQ